MTTEEVRDLCAGTPLVLTAHNGSVENVFFRSARYSAHVRQYLVCVADVTGAPLAVAAAELSRRFREDE